MNYSETINKMNFTFTNNQEYRDILKEFMSDEFTEDGIIKKHNVDITINNFFLNENKRFYDHFISQEYELIYDLKIIDKHDMIDNVDMCFGNYKIMSADIKDNEFYFNNINIKYPIPLCAFTCTTLSLRIYFKHNNVLNKTIELSYNGIYLKSRREFIKMKHEYLGFNFDKLESLNNNLIDYYGSYKLYKSINKLPNNVNTETTIFSFLPFYSGDYTVKKLCVLSDNKEIVDIKYKFGSKYLTFNKNNDKWNISIDEIPCNNIYSAHELLLTSKFKEDTIVEIEFDLDKLVS